MDGEPSIIIDLQQHRVTRDGAPLALQGKTFELLVFFAQNPGRLLSKEAILRGVWPDTHRTCFEGGWLEQFFSLLEANADWIRMTLPSEVIREEPPAGTIWLPECSCREMTEWVLPPAKQLACIEARQAAKTRARRASRRRLGRCPRR